MVIPTRKIVGDILHYFGNIRQLDIVVGVACDTNLKAAVAAINAVLAANPRVLEDPAPVVQAIQLGDSAVHIGMPSGTSRLARRKEMRIR